MVDTNRPDYRVSSNSNPLDPITGITSLIGTALGDITHLISTIGHEPAIGAVTKLVSGVFNGSEKTIRLMMDHPGNIASWMSDAEADMGYPFVWALLTQALGLDMSKANEKLHFPTKGQIANWEHKDSTLSVDAGKGIHALSKLTAFIIGTNLLFAGLGGVMKLILAQRWESQIDENIGRIGEQLGLNWAMGETLGELMQVLTSRQLEEFANVQVHPNRLDMMMIRQLARQHHVTQEQFWSLLDLQGYPNDLKALILQMDTQQLMPADLQTLWSIGKMSRTEVETYLGHLGYSDGDVQLLLTEWIDHSETQESATFRATLRSDYLQHKIGPEAYRDMLAQLLTKPHSRPALPREGQPNYEAAPEQVRLVIDLAVSSANFANDYGRVSITVADLSKRLKAGWMSRGEFVSKLESLGYSKQDADHIAGNVQMAPLTGKPGLTSAKVLQYTASQVLTPQQAYTMLVRLGMNPKDAAFLAWNPKASTGPWGYPDTVQTIEQAYIDGVLDNETATAHLERLGTGPGAIKEYLTLWHYQAGHQVLLDKKAIEQDAHWKIAYRDSLRALYMGGGLGDATLVNLLEEAGLAPTDAYYTWAGWYTERHGTPPGAPGGPSG